MIETTTEVTCDRCTKTKVFKEESREEISKFLTGEGWMTIILKWFGEAQVFASYLLCNACAISINEEARGARWIPTPDGVTIEQVDASVMDFDEPLAIDFEPPVPTTVD